MPKRKTHEQFIKEISQINPKIEILGKYINNNTKIKCRCIIDFYEWEATPHNLLQHIGCPTCGGTKKKTHEEFCDELYNVNNNIELLNTYIDSKHKIKCRCLIDGYIWNSLPENLLKGHGCPKCSLRVSSESMLKSHEEFVSQVKILSPTIKVISKYKNSQLPVKCSCNICGNIWETVANNLSNGKGCPKCAINKRTQNITKTKDAFISELYQINSDIEIIGEYINSNTPITCKCKVDNNIWKALPLNLLKGTGCPVCQNSHGEKAISAILDDLNIKYIPQYKFNDCKNIRSLPFDFYLPNFITCIEYDGQQHFKPVKFGGCTIQQATKSFEKTKENDFIKNKYCQDNNINLIRIKYSEFNNIRNIIKKEISF